MKRLALVVALALLATLPVWIGNSYYINIATQMLIYAILALGLNMLVGYAGLVTLGHAGLFGIAAYAGAVLINDGPPREGEHAAKAGQRHFCKGQEKREQPGRARRDGWFLIGIGGRERTGRHERT